MQPKKLVNLAVILLLLLLLLHLKRTSGVAPFPSMERYSTLIEEPTCQIVLDNLISVMPNNDDLIVSYSNLNFTSIVAYNVVKKIIDQRRPIAFVDIDGGERDSVPKNITDRLTKQLPENVPMKALLAMPYTENIILFQIRVMYAMSQVPRDILLIRFGLTTTTTTNIIRDVGRYPLVSCKLLEFPAKDQPFWKRLPYGNGSFPLIHNQNNDLKCLNSNEIPESIPVTFINNIYFSYFNARLSLVPFEVFDSSDTPYFYGFNRQLNKIYFARKLRYLEWHVPDYYAPNWLPTQWHPFLVYDYVYIIAQDWVFYFPYLDIDHRLAELGFPDIIVAPLKVMHAHQFFRCNKGNPTRAGYDDARFEVFITNVNERYYGKYYVMIFAMVTLTLIIGLIYIYWKKIVEILWLAYPTQHSSNSLPGNLFLAYDRPMSPGVSTGTSMQMSPHSMTSQQKNLFTVMSQHKNLFSVASQHKNPYSKVAQQKNQHSMMSQHKNLHSMMSQHKNPHSMVTQQKNRHSMMSQHKNPYSMVTQHKNSRTP